MNISPKLSAGQLRALHSLFHLYAPRFLDAADIDAGSDAARTSRLAWASKTIGRELSSFSGLQQNEAAQLLDVMKEELGQEVNPVKTPRRRRPDRDMAHIYGTAGRRNARTNQIQMVDAPTLELLDRLRGKLGWTREGLDAFLRSKRSPVRSGRIHTIAEANRVIWALKSISRQKGSASPGTAASDLKQVG
ncbi:MAG: hypothetical protein WA789_20175 [Candidatus Acidiferrum sp.]